MQSFTDKVCEITGVLTINSPTYVLFAADNEAIQEKFNQLELQHVRVPVIQNVQHGGLGTCLQFTLFRYLQWMYLDQSHLQQIKTFSMKNFNIQVIAVGEIIFGTKIKSVVNGNFTVYNLKDYEDTQKISTRANIFSKL